MLPESAVIMLLMGSLLAFFKAMGSRPFPWIWLCGMGLALASLGRGEFFLTPGLFVLWLLWKVRGRRAAWMSFFLLIGFASIQAPWIWRNSRLFGRLVLSTTNYSEGFLVAHSPTYRFGGITPVYPPELREALRGQGELESARIQWDWAMNYIRAYPGRTVLTTLGNLLVFWRPTLTLTHIPWKFNIAYSLFAFPLLVFFLYGLLQVRYLDNRDEWIFLIFLIAYKTLIHLPFYMVNRFRESISPVLIVFAVLGILIWCKEHGCESV